MKILDSNILFSSENYLNQMDLSLEKKTKNHTIRLINSSTIDVSDDIPQILVDRVSISQREKFKSKYNYSGNLASKSSVKSLVSGDVKDHEHQYAIERMVGGIIDKNVVIRQIQRKEDIRLSDQKILTPDNNDKKKQTIQTQIVAAKAVEMKLVRTDIHFEEENVQFASTGEVTTEDGRVINFSLDMTLERSFLSKREQERIVETWQERIALTDPLVISLDGKIPQLSDTTFEFDLDSDGKMENISFLNPGSGFLAFDKNNDNIINNGSELFGPGNGNGFNELAAFDEDNNNWIDENDSVFTKLSVWTKDANGEDLLVSLKEAGIGAISLANASTRFNMTESDNNLNGQLKSTGVFLFEDGKAGSIHQIDLADKTQQILEKEKSQLSLDSEFKQQFQMPNSFSIPVLTGTQSSQQAGDIPNPLQDLIDRIDKLKSEMEQLLESRNHITSRNHISNKNRFKNSKNHNYFEYNIDMTALFFGSENSTQSYRGYI